jgi:Flp pilus assembly protein TadG
MMSFFKRLRLDEQGASLIEMAFAAPILATIVIGMSDLANVYSMTLQTEQAAQRTIEQVENQRSVSATSYNTALTTEATAAMTAAGFTVVSSDITPESWLECGTSTTHQSFTGSCATSTDTVARYVSVRITHKYTPFFPGRAWPNADANGDLTVAGYAEVRIQ